MGRSGGGRTEDTAVEDTAEAIAVEASEVDILQEDFQEEDVLQVEAHLVEASAEVLSEVADPLEVDQLEDHTEICIGGDRPPRRHGFFFGSSGGGCGCVSFAMVWLILVICIFSMVISSMFSNVGTSSVAESTKEREALSGVVTETSYYQDDIGWITNSSKLTSGLKDFYKATGVQPYVLFVPYSSTYWTSGTTFNESKATDYLETVYSNTFEDEGHFIFAYFQCKNDSKSEMDGEFYYLSGYSADTIMDDEALEIFWGYFEINCYDTSLSIEEMISNTFSETAENIMSTPTNGWDVLIVIFVVIAVILIIYIIYKAMKDKHKREKEKEEYTKEILDKPLETFGDTDTSELEKKYEDKKDK